MDRGRSALNHPKKKTPSKAGIGISRTATKCTAALLLRLFNPSASGFSSAFF
jgi:hypothetical protein